MMFEAYVTNLGMYPEYGVEVGEYLKFPTNVEEVPRPGRGGADRCAGCRYLKECGNRKGRCRKQFRTSGQVGPKS